MRFLNRQIASPDQKIGIAKMGSFRNDYVRFLNRRIAFPDPIIGMTSSFRNDFECRCSVLTNKLHLFKAKSI